MSSEAHPEELVGHFLSAIEAAKQAAVIFLVLWVAIPNLSISLLFSIACGLLIFQAGTSALAGWYRLERLHKVIEQERFEIEHHRDQERQELREMYAAKGFKEQLLDDVVDVLMADDNRLLSVMLEEELGLPLEAYEHPLKQALGAFLGALVTICVSLAGFYFWPLGIPIFTLLIVSITSIIRARCEKRSQMNALVWNLSLTFFIGGAVHFISRLVG